MSIALQKDARSLLRPRAACVNTAITAGGAGDNTAITGATIDRLTSAGIPLNAQIILYWTATLAQAATLILKTVKVQDSADGTTWADYASYTDPGVVATGPTGGGTLTDVLEVAGVDLGSARRYVRLLFTPDLSAASIDTARIGAIFNLAGFDRLPA